MTLPGDGTQIRSKMQHSTWSTQSWAAEFGTDGIVSECLGCRPPSMSPSIYRQGNQSPERWRDLAEVHNTSKKKPWIYIQIWASRSWPMVQMPGALGSKLILTLVIFCTFNTLWFINDNSGYSGTLVRKKRKVHLLMNLLTHIEVSAMCQLWARYWRHKYGPDTYLCAIKELMVR